ncbi:glycosyltransferase [Fibrobacter succinogenes]|uniref:glycosyltransferase family 2 protein n=1 Tax=Fibrobacter succinogenes TaxID=833 RepID=UPI0026EB95F3|nr:glycosyltransferase [Fibrobacter succinogenes]
MEYSVTNMFAEKMDENVYVKAFVQGSETEQREMPPLVSVLMASYNHEKYVEAAVRSIMAQKGVAFELIVIDDGSTDSSPEILERLQAELKFSYIHRPNRGLVATMNELVSMARGKYFCSFASDDIMPQGRLEKQSAYLELHPEESLCFGQIVLMDKDGNHGEEFDPRYTHSIPRVTFDEFFLGEKEVHGCSEMIRLDFFREYGGYDTEFPFEDFPLWLKFFKICGFISVLPVNCCYYRQHGNNMSLDNTLMYGTFLKVLERYSDHKRYKEAVNIWKSHWFSMLAYRDKIDAIRKLPQLWSFSRPFLKRFPKLFIPRFLLKR